MLQNVFNIIYATCSIITCDFDWSYAKSDVIMPKKVLYIDHMWQFYKTIFDVIYATSGILPCDFDWGYANSGIIM